MDDTRMVPIEDLKFQKQTETLPVDLIDHIALIHHAFRDRLLLLL